MAESREWNWNAVDHESWLRPAEESYYYAEKWKWEGRRDLLDLGCGLGRHSVFFNSKGFNVTACDLSDTGVNHLRQWQRRENINFPSIVCDMKKLPFANNSFDCIWGYHVLSHTDTSDFRQILSEVRRVLRDGGVIFLDLCSKDMEIFKDESLIKLDENTRVFVGGPEDGIPHLFVDREDIDSLMSDFELIRIRHIHDLDTPLTKGGGIHYFIEAVAKK